MFRTNSLVLLVVVCGIVGVALGWWLGKVITIPVPLVSVPGVSSIVGPPENLVSDTPLPTPNPTPVPTPWPRPAQYSLATMSHAYQRLNNCGPVSASMAASAVGVTFDQFQAAVVMKGGPSDKNVSPYELVSYLESQGLRATYRVNGNTEMIETLLAQDIPVIVEQWLAKPENGELVGHYRVVRGYDQNQQRFHTNDSYNGPGFTISYHQFDEWWRPFNRTYIVVYKPEQESLVQSILGRDWDEQSNWHQSVAQAEAEIEAHQDGYAWFNLGSSRTHLGEYEAAALAFDQALQKSFPEHFLWYQFTVLEAYFQVGRTQQVLDLTTSLLAKAGEVEEARYYRGVVYLQLERPTEAMTEFERAITANPRYEVARQKLTDLKRLQP